MQEACNNLPGKDCGACGAPSCTTFAEDLVLERSVIGDCPFMSDAKRGCRRMRLPELAQELNLKELTPSIQADCDVTAGMPRIC